MLTKQQAVEHLLSKGFVRDEEVTRMNNERVGTDDWVLADDKGRLVMVCSVGSSFDLTDLHTATSYQIDNTHSTVEGLDVLLQEFTTKMEQ